MRTRAKLLIVFLILVMVVFSAGVWFLRSQRFQVMARNLLVERLREATGLECRIEDFNLDLFGGRFRAKGLVLEPRPGEASLLRLKVDEVNGSFTIVSFMKRTFDLTELTLVQPQLRLNLGQGTSAFDPEKFLKGLRKSLEFGAKHVAIRGGWFELNDQRMPFDLSLNDLICELVYSNNPVGYRIRLGYKNSHVVWSGRDISYDLDARVFLSLQGLDIESYELRRQKTLLRGKGLMLGWNSPVLSLTATGSIAAEDLQLFYSDLKDARGDIKVDGTFRWEPGESANSVEMPRPSVSSLSSSGKFSVNGGRFRDVVFDSLEGLFEIQDDVLILKDTKGRLGSGNLRADGSFQLREIAKEPHRLKVSVESLPIKTVGNVLHVPGLRLENTMDSVMELTWRKGLEDLQADGKVKLHGAKTAALPAANYSPLEGDAEFNYRRGAWNIRDARMRSPNTEIQVASQTGSSFRVLLKTDRLSEPLAIVRIFSPGLENLLKKYPDLMAASGQYGLEGNASIESMTEMVFRGNITIAGGQWRIYHADSLSGAVYWNGKDLELQGLRIQDGMESAEGNFKLTLPASDEGVPDIAFRGTVRNIQLAALEKRGIEFKTDLTGTLSGNGAVSYRRGLWEAEGNFQIDKGQFYKESFDALRARVRLSGSQLQIIEGQAVRGAGKAVLNGQVNFDTQDLDLTVRLTGFPMKDLPLIRERGLNLEAVVTAAFEVRGKQDDPVVQGNFNVEGLRYESWDLGRGKGTLTLKNRIVDGVATVQSDLGSFAVRARVSTEAPNLGKATLEFKDWNVQKLIEADLPPILSELSTAISGTVEVEGRFAESSSLTYRGEMDGARVKIHEYELRNSGKIRFNISGQTLKLEETKFVGDQSNLALSGEIPLENIPTLNLRLQGDLDLRFLEHLETRLAISGTAKLDVRATGTLRNPQIIGRATLNSARFDYGNLPFHLSSMRGDIIFSRNLIRLENVQGSAATGKIQLSGSLEHQNAELQGINLQVSAQGARLSYPKDFRTVLDGNLILRGGRDSQVLTGDVKILRAEYIRDFNLFEQLAARSTALQSSQVSEPLLAGIRMNVSIRSDDGLIIDNELLKLVGRINLTLRGTPAYPSLTGRVEATEGQIFFRGNRFEIIHASADFVDRNRINPIFDIRAESDVRTYRLLLDVSGDLDNLRSSVRSDPPLSTVDIVGLLATGKSWEAGDSSRRQAEITGLSAASILSESLTGVLGKRVERLFGLESFRVDPFLAGAENDPTARITISQRLSKDVTITFSRNLGTHEEQIVLVEYAVSRNLSIVGTRDEDGKFSLDFRFRKRLR